MDLQRYDIIKANVKYEGGSVQTKERPYVIVSNPIGTKYATIITVMPLTSKIKKLNMPVHGCINADDKNGRLDLRAIINGNTECDIEVQLTSNDNIAERFVYYWAKMYAANLKIGDTYSDLRKTISIIILDDDFKLTKNLGKPQTTWKIRESENTHLILTDYFEIIIIEIPKVLKAYHKNPNDEVLQWMLFLDNPEKEEVTRIMEENKDIKEAKEELDRISQDDILRRKALNRTLEIADRLQLKKEAEEALEKGKKEKTNEIVKRMKDADLSIEQIAQIVKLKVDEVKAILNEKN